MLIHPTHQIFLIESVYFHQILLIESVYFPRMTIHLGIVHLIHRMLLIEFAYSDYLFVVCGGVTTISRLLYRYLLQNTVFFTGLFRKIDLQF